MTQKALKLSQEALAGLKDVEKQVRELVAENKALKEALAQTQEPFCLHWEDRWGCNHYADPKEPHPVNAKPLYTTPPQRTWVGLTDEQRSQLVTLHHGWNEYGQAIEASLKQQNGYAEEKNT